MQLQALLSSDRQLNSESTKQRQLLLALVIAVGVILRLYHFFYNRSLWEDEVYLSAGIVNRSLHQILTQPLPYLQKAPLGYLLVAKLMVTLFGNHEMPLRLYSLLCGTAALFVFVPVARYYLKSTGIITAITILAFGPPLVYHSVEAKPYGTELLATIIIIWLYIHNQAALSWRKLLAWGFWGALLVWFAYTGLFVLAATGLAIAIQYVKAKHWQALFRLMVPGAMWLISFAVSYVLYAKEGSQSGWLVDFWQKHDGYMPLQPVSAVTWLIHRVYSVLHYPLGLSWGNTWLNESLFKQLLNRMVFIPLAFLVLGAVYFAKSKPQFLLLSTLGLLIAVAASALKLYPVHERLTVYLAPYFIVFVAGGADFFDDKSGWAKSIGFVLTAGLLFGPIKNIIDQTVHPYLFGDYKKSYQREALAYVQSHQKPGDILYIYHNDLPGYKLYQAIYPMQLNAVSGKDYRNSTSNFKDYFAAIDADIKTLPGKRVWIVYQVMDAKVGEYVDQPAWYYAHHDGIEQLEKHLPQLGTKLDAFKPADGSPINNVKAVLIEVK